MGTGVYSGFFLIDMNVRNTILRYTTLPFDAVVSGVTYSSDNSLAGVDPPKLSSNTDREAFKIKFADPLLSYAGLADEMIGSRVTVRGGFYNTSGGTIIDSTGTEVLANNPILNYTDCIVLYKGFIDIVRYNISEEDGAIFEIECASPMASLDALNSFYTTQNSIRQRIPAAQWSTAPDTCFDNVALGGKSQEVLWGKI